MWILAGLIASLLLAVLIYLASQNGRFHVLRSLEIDATVESVYAAVLDLKSWPLWSPWLMQEAGARLDYSETVDAEGGYCSWDGKIVGAGKVTHVEIRNGRTIQQQLEFKRPFKSVGQVDWEFKKIGVRSLVTWEMRGKMPFLYRFMAKRMEPMIGRDFELGLALLGGYLNEAIPHPQLKFVGEEKLEQFHYWAIPFNGNLRQLEAARRSSIETLRSSPASRIGLALTLYQQFDPLGVKFQAEIAVPTGDNPPLSNYRQRSFDGGHYFKMTLQGDLRFLPLGWHALASHCRMHKIKTEPTRPALEIYHQDPGATDNSNQQLTTLFLPIRK